MWTKLSPGAARSEQGSEGGSEGERGDGPPRVTLHPTSGAVTRRVPRSSLMLRMAAGVERAIPVPVAPGMKSTHLIPFKLSVATGAESKASGSPRHGHLRHMSYIVASPRKGTIMRVSTKMTLGLSATCLVIA